MATKMSRHEAGVKPGTVGHKLNIMEWHDRSLATSFPLYVPKL